MDLFVSKKQINIEDISYKTSSACLPHSDFWKLICYHYC